MIRLFRLWRLGGHDLKLLWFALRHPARPAWLLAAAAALCLYALDPVNFALPLVGIVDDAILLPLLLHGLAKFVPPIIRSAYEQRRLSPR